MRGTIWSLLAAAIGTGIMLFVGVPAARPASGSAASSTNAAAAILEVTSPLMGTLLMLAALGVIVAIAFRNI